MFLFCNKSYKNTISSLYIPSGKYTFFKISRLYNLFHDAQEIAIMTGKEILSIEVFNEAYKSRMDNLHNYIETQTEIKVVPKVRKRKTKYETVTVIDSGDFTIQELSNKARKEKLDIVELLKERISIIEVSIV